MKQREILSKLSPDFARDGQTDYIPQKQKQIVDFLAQYLRVSGMKGFVLGVSGGIDSFLAGCLCAQACAQERAKLHLLMLPNGTQSDIADAKVSVDLMQGIYPEAIAETISIEHSFAGMVQDLRASKCFEDDAVTLGNLQPRLRMTAQYALARKLLVVGTDHAAESVTGFFTKYGDGGTDINPLQDLIKDDIYAMSASYGAPQALLNKQPAAGLGITETDEQELGIAYADICAYLKGNLIDAALQQKLEGYFECSRHKRRAPASLLDRFDTKPLTTHIVTTVENEEKTIAYINAHPRQNVLYVQRPGVQISRAYYERVIKTTNTPIERFNIFETQGIVPRNEIYGALDENAFGRVVVSGKANAMFELEHVLTDKQITIL